MPGVLPLYSGPIGRLPYKFVRKLEAPASRTDQVKNITVLQERGGRVSWNEKSNLITFDMKGKDGLYDIYVMNPDGSNKIRLTKFNDNRHPVSKVGMFCADLAWSPESDRIAAYVQTNLVTQDGILIMIDLDYDTVQKIKFGN